MADFILPVKPVVLPAIGTPVAGVTCQPIYQVGADGLVRYRDQDGTVLAFPGGVSHSTVLGTCPATGPTVAPTAEGHYYWTSTLGEKWCWVYGDAAPFVVGKFYRYENFVSPFISAPHNTYVQGLAAPAVPRTGIVSVTTYMHIRATVSPIVQSNSNLRRNGGILTYRFDGDIGVQSVGNHTLIVTTYESIQVVAGDILTVWGSQTSSNGSSAGVLEYVYLSYTYRD